MTCFYERLKVIRDRYSTCYVYENVFCCFSILASLNSIRQSEVLQILHQCAVPTRDVPEWLTILLATALNAEFHVDITIHMAKYGGFVKMIEIKVTSTYSVGESFFIFSCANL